MRLRHNIIVSRSWQLFFTRFLNCVPINMHKITSVE